MSDEVFRFGYLFRIISIISWEFFLVCPNCWSAFRTSDFTSLDGPDGEGDTGGMLIRKFLFRGCELTCGDVSFRDGFPNSSIAK